MALNKQRNG